MENNALEKMCNKIVDVIYETFTHKYYFVKISQSKKGHVYLTVRKKRGRLDGEEENGLHKSCFTFPAACFIGTAIGMIFCVANTFSIQS